MKKQKIKDIAIILILALITLPIFSIIIDKSNFVNKPTEQSIYRHQYTPNVNKNKSYKPQSTNYKPSHNSITGVNDILSANSIPADTRIATAPQARYPQPSFHTQANQYKPSKTQHENKYHFRAQTMPIGGNEAPTTTNKKTDNQYKSSFASNWSNIRAPFSNKTPDGTIIVGPSTDPSEENRIPVGNGHYVLLICIGGYTLYKKFC